VTSRAISEDGRRGASLWWLAWAGVALFCFAAAVYFSGRERQYVNETIRLRQQLEFAAAQLAEWRQAAAILTADPAVTTFKQAQPGGVSVGVIDSPTRGVLLFVSHLPPLANGKVYEIWFERPGKNPAAAGVLRPNRDGSAIHVERTASIAGARAIAITQENAGGAGQPTSPPIFEAAMPHDPLR
jgi:Anti-sigma-K factor rskA, C-terminal